MSEELAATAIAIAIISKSKITERKRKRIGFVVISNNSAKILKAFSLALRSLHDLAFTSHKPFSHSAMKDSFTPTFYLHPFLILKFFPYSTSFKVFRLFSEVPVRARSLVVSDLRSETKSSLFEPGCYLCAEVEPSAVIARLKSKCL